MDEFYAPELALYELHRYEPLLLKKSKLTKQELDDIVTRLQNHVTFMPWTFYQHAIPTVLHDLQHSTQQELQELLDDIDFLALAVTLHCPLWSRDRLLKQQSIVQVFTTSDVVSYKKNKRKN